MSDIERIELRSVDIAPRFSLGQVWSNFENDRQSTYTGVSVDLGLALNVPVVPGVRIYGLGSYVYRNFTDRRLGNLDSDTANRARVALATHGFRLGPGFELFLLSLAGVGLPPWFQLTFHSEGQAGMDFYGNTNVAFQPEIYGADNKPLNRFSVGAQAALSARFFDLVIGFFFRQEWGYSRARNRETGFETDMVPDKARVAGLMLEYRWGASDPWKPAPPVIQQAPPPPPPLAPPAPPFQACPEQVTIVTVPAPQDKIDLWSKDDPQCEPCGMDDLKALYKQWSDEIYDPALNPLAVKQDVLDGLVSLGISEDLARTLDPQMKLVAIFGGADGITPQGVELQIVLTLGGRVIYDRSLVDQGGPLQYVTLPKLKEWVEQQRQFLSVQEKKEAVVRAFKDNPLAFITARPTAAHLKALRQYVSKMDDKGFEGYLKQKDLFKNVPGELAKIDAAVGGIKEIEQVLGGKAQFYVHGTADAAGGDQGNFDLSARRAELAYLWLRLKGLQPTGFIGTGEDTRFHADDVAKREVRLVFGPIPDPWPTKLADLDATHAFIASNQASDSIVVINNANMKVASTLHKASDLIVLADQEIRKETNPYSTAACASLIVGLNLYAADNAQASDLSVTEARKDDCICDMAPSVANPQPMVLKKNVAYYDMWISNYERMSIADSEDHFIAIFDIPSNFPIANIASQKRLYGMIARPVQTRIGSVEPESKPLREALSQLKDEIAPINLADLDGEAHKASAMRDAFIARIDLMLQKLDALEAWITESIK